MWWLHVPVLYGVLVILCIMNTCTNERHIQRSHMCTHTNMHTHSNEHAVGDPSLTNLLSRLCTVPLYPGNFTWCQWSHVNYYWLLYSGHKAIVPQHVAEVHFSISQPVSMHLDIVGYPYATSLCIAYTIYGMHIRIYRIHWKRTQDCFNFH